MIVDGCAWQPLMWERPTSDDAGSVSHDAAPRGAVMNRTTKRTPGQTLPTTTRRGASRRRRREDARGGERGGLGEEL